MSSCSMRGEAPGAGSTGRATGGFRVQFATAIDVRLSLLARAKLRRFTEETGGDCGYDPAGYLWLASNDAELVALRAALAVQRANGVDDAVEVDRETISRLNPALDAGAVAGGTYCPSDGFIRPLGILDGYRRAAERWARGSCGMRARSPSTARATGASAPCAPNAMSSRRVRS